jgi:phenylpropionate dioxygenase-like ring-hydroxylating dioxygenase large terminal subunit
VRELVGRLIVETSQPQLDRDAIALGLIGVLEMLWQDFAFRTESEIDRQAAKRRCMAYLRSIFPGQFAPAPLAAAAEGPAAGGNRLAGWVYDNARLYAIERQSVFRDAWQIVGHEAQIPRPGAFLSVDLGVERALLVRDRGGVIHAFRNSCTEVPHVLIAAGDGRISGTLDCAVHGLHFDLNGHRQGARGGADLILLELRIDAGLLLVRSPRRARPAAAEADPWTDLQLPAGSRPQGLPSETVIRADWKLVVEQWLEFATGEAARHSEATRWSARRYARLAGSDADFAWRRRFVTPNHLVEVRPDGFSILQVLPAAPGRSVQRRYHFTVCESERVARALQYLATRLGSELLGAQIALAESTQQGIVVFGYEAAHSAVIPRAVAAFRRRLVSLVPAMALDRPPVDS